MSIQLDADDVADLRHQILDLIARYHTAAHRAKPFIPGESPVPVSGRVYDQSDMQTLVDSALDFWLTTGRFNEQFEEKLGQFVGTKFALTVNSGSSANLVAFAALTSHLLKDRALKPGDEVITTSTGFPTTVNPILLYGLVPVFVDVHIPTYNIDVTQIEAAITPKTRAIMVAHTLGNPFDLAAITELARKYNLFLIEDCCDALGATYNSQKVGTFGDVATLSFYPAHHITMGEGGAVLMNRPLIKRAAESIRDWGRDCYCPPGKDNTCGRRFDWQLGDLPEGYDHKYIYSHIGYNLKITDMQAAVGLAQLGHLEEFIAIRRFNYNRLRDGLKQVESQLILPEATPNSDPSWFGFPLTMRTGAAVSRDELVLHLNEKRIGTRLLFGGNLIHQPYMIGRNFRTIGNLPQSDTVMRQTFWIGVYPGLTPTAIDYMIDTITSLIRSRTAG
jgi:CDP-6-deoxy-D-xylo-4-hexulose-3-dehydrase